MITLVKNSVCKRHATSLEKHDRDAVLLIKIRSFAVSGGGAGLLRRAPMKGGGAAYYDERNACIFTAKNEIFSKKCVFS